MHNPISSEIRFILWSLALFLSLVAFYPYIRDVLTKKTKPHAFSWLIWATLSGIAFAIQVSENGGFGAYVTGLAALLSLTMATLGFINGDTGYRTADFISLICAAIALLLWWKTSDPTYSTILLSIINLVGFVPSIRKCLSNPFSETIIAWWIFAIRGFFGVSALAVVTFNTAFYPFVNATANLAFVFFLLALRTIRKS